MSSIVSILMRLEQGTRSHAQDAVMRLRRSLGAVDAEIVLIDATPDGCISGEGPVPDVGARSQQSVSRGTDSFPGTVIVRDHSPNRISGWKMATRHTSSPYITWFDHRTQVNATAWAAQIRALESDPRLQVVLGGVEAIGEISDEIKLDEPSLVWQSRAMARRDVIESFEETLYAPNETELFQALGAKGAVSSVEDTVVHWPAQDLTFEEARGTLDRRWLDISKSSIPPATPDVSVIICTYNRRATLLRCLESFCRQLIAPGTFEIIVTDDDSPDGTSSVLAETQWPVPVKFIPRPRGGLAEARNEAISIAEGRLLLLINDDTIAYPNLIEAHIAAHRQHEGKAMAVLGTFDQPPQALQNAMMRAIEHTSFGFPYQGMKSGQIYNWHKFWTCNLSVPTELVKSVGSFDEDYEVYGCEDSDLGYRLEQKGLQVFYTDSAKAFHDHPQDLASIAKRQKTLARANVRFFAKNPQALQEPTWQGLRGLKADQCQREIQRRRSQAEALIQAAEGLCRVQVGALEGLDGPLGTLGGEITKGVLQILNELNTYWWLEGSALGFEDLGVSGYPDIAEGRATSPPRKLRDAGSQEPWPLHSESKTKILVWPEFTDDDLRTLFLEYGSLFLENPSYCLCIRHDARVDGPIEEATQSLEQAFDRYIGAEQDMDVLLVPETMSSYDWPRFGKAINAMIVLPSSTRPTRLAFQKAVNAKIVRSAHELRAITASETPSLAGGI